MGKSHDLGLCSEGLQLANKYFVCHFEEKTVDHVLLHCMKSVLCQILSGPMGVERVFSSKGAQKPWRPTSICLSWTVWKKKEQNHLNSEGSSVLRLKASFACNISEQTKE